MRNHRFKIIATLGVLCVAAFAFGCTAGNTSSGASGTEGEATTSPAGTDDCSGDDCEAVRSSIATCSGYEQSCNGSCVDVHADPDHCGTCGNRCGSDRVCSQGNCADDCAGDREECGGRCVDIDLDSDHCGSCGNSCGAGEGCVDGTCTDLAGASSGPKSCAGGGPPIFTGKGTGEAGKCTGDLARKTFRWALCSCDGIKFGNEFYTDGYDSKKGPYQSGLGGGVGTNGPVRGGNSATIRGALWTSSGEGVRVGNSLEVGQQLHSKGTFFVGNSGEVGSDAYVGGDVVAGNSLEIGETLYLDPQGSVRGDVTYGNLVEQSQQFSTVCKRCSSSDRIPVGDIVRRHRPPSNDNEAIGLSPDVLASHSSDVDRLDLPCGEYYLSRLAIDNGATIVAHGNVALYIAGDIEVGNSLTIEPAPGATLDVFVAGNVRAGNSLEIGDMARPAATRFYVGGSDGWDFGNSAEVAGFVYAVPGGIRGGNSLDLYGGLYTQSIRHGNSVEIHYDRQILDSGRDCPGGNPGDRPGDDGSAPDAGNGDGDGDQPSPDAGGYADTGGSSGGGDDGGGSGQCKDRGTSCSSDSECCAPLICHEGSCTVVECRTVGTSCSEDADCCSGVCDGTACVGG